MTGIESFQSLAKHFVKGQGFSQFKMVSDVILSIQVLGLCEVHMIYAQKTEQVHLISYMDADNYSDKSALFEALLKFNFSPQAKQFYVGLTANNQHLVIKTHHNLEHLDVATLNNIFEQQLKISKHWKRFGYDQVAADNQQETIDSAMVYAIRP